MNIESFLYAFLIAGLADPTSAVHGLFHTRTQGGFEHLHRVFSRKLLADRSADAGSRENIEEGQVGAADSIVLINGDDCADHAFQHLTAKRALTPGFIHAPVH